MSLAIVAAMHLSCGLGARADAPVGSKPGSGAASTTADRGLEAGSATGPPEHAKEPNPNVRLGMLAVERGDPAQALAHFDRALRGQPDLAPAIAFNRAVCLFMLARFGEAEVAFIEVADRAPSPLSALAALNAGFAALEAGARGRAAKHLARARTLDPEGAVEELATDLADELAAPGSRPIAQTAHDGPGDNPADNSEAAVSAVPPLADQRFDAGEEAFRAGRFADARQHLLGARSMGLSGWRGSEAQAYLDVLAGGLRAQGRGLRVGAYVGGGVDTNVNEIGPGDANSVVGGSSEPETSPYLRLALDAALGIAPSDSTFFRLRYLLSQVAYTEASVDAFSTQLHQLSADAEIHPTPTLRLRGGTFGGIDLLGRTFAPLSLYGGFDGRIGARYGEGFDTEARGRVTWTRSVRDNFGFLDGNRAELAIAQTYQTPTLLLGAEVRYRREQLGTQTLSRQLQVSGSSQADDLLANAQTPAWLASFIRDSQVPGAVSVPLSYDAPGLEAFADLGLARRLRLHLRGSIEWRTRHEPTAIAIEDADKRLYAAELVSEAAANNATRAAELSPRLAEGLASSLETTRVTQRDTRYSATVGLSLETWSGIWLGLSYVLLHGDSNIDNRLGGSHVNDYANLNFTRHLAELSLTVR